MSGTATRLIVLAFTLCISGCAFDVMRLEQSPVQLTTAGPCGIPFILSADAHISLRGGYSRTLKQGTHWQCIGSIPQGQVYGTQDQVLTVEASNIYEARLVVQADRLVGFYLPVERTFSPLSTPVQISRKYTQDRN